jgi:hypothetical protein
LQHHKIYREITLLQRQKPQTIKQWQATKQTGLHPLGLLANLHRVLDLNRQASLQAACLIPSLLIELLIAEYGRYLQLMLMSVLDDLCKSTISIETLSGASRHPGTYVR